LSAVLESYGVDPERWPPASVILILSGISRFLLLEEAFDVDVGHAETEAIVEGYIRSLEGERILRPSVALGDGGCGVTDSPAPLRTCRAGRANPPSPAAQSGE
jgi:hypothetical protein